MTQALTVEVVEFAAPMILANSGFLQTLETVEAQVKALTITDSTTAQQAADIQSRLTKAATTLDDQRKALNKPFNDQITAINAAAKGPASRIEIAKRAVAAALTAFAVAEQQRVAEENRKRQEELAALQEQQRLETEARVKMDAQLYAFQIQADAIDDDWGAPAVPVVVAPTETERKIAAVAVPVAPVARPSGVTIRTTLKATVEDITKVPEIFIERAIKMRAIESTFCVRWSEDKPMPTCPGIKFEIDRKTVTTR